MSTPEIEHFVIKNLEWRVSGLGTEEFTAVGATALAAAHADGLPVVARKTSRRGYTWSVPYRPAEFPDARDLDARLDAAITTALDPIRQRWLATLSR